MEFELIHEVADSDFAEIGHMAWSSLQQPRQAMMNYMFYVDEKRGVTLDSAVQSWAKGQVAARAAGSGYLWKKVIEKKTGRIVGAAGWIVHREDPWAKGMPKKDADSHPAGADREAVIAIAHQLTIRRMEFTSEPHLYLGLVFTHPDFRRRGVAGLFLRWGNDFADENGWEITLAATETGLSTYQKYGFIPAERMELNLNGVEPSERLEELKQILLPIVVWPMIRPRNSHDRAGAGGNGG